MINELSLTNILLLGMGGIFFVGLFTKFIIVSYLKLLFYKRQGIPIKFIPLVGELMEMNKDSQEKGDCYHKQKQMIKKNPKVRLYAVNYGSVPIIHLIDPILLKEYFKNQQLYIKERSALGFLANIADKSLLFTEGDKWKQQRRLISRVFHYEFIKEMIPSIQKITIKHLDILASNPNLERVKLLDVFQNITGDIVGSLFFSNDLDSLKFEGKSLTDMMASILKNVFDFMYDPLYHLIGQKYLQLGIRGVYRKLNKDIKNLRKFALKIVQSRKKNYEVYKTKSKDLLLLLIEKQKEGGDNFISDDEIIDQFFIFFIAGMDTTAHLVAMMTYNLTQSPEYRRNLELDILKYYSACVSTESLNKMEYMDQFIKEVLRLHSPAKELFFREATVDHNLGDIKIKKGTIVQPQLSMNNYNSLYYDEPEKFKPERWEPKSLYNKEIKETFINIPFSAGARNCIGQHLALIEAKIIFSEFFKKFNFKLSEGYKLRMTYRFVYEPVDDLIFDLNKNII